MTDDSQLPEAELAALADGSLPAGRREQLQSRVAASPELQASLGEQERAVAMLRALDQPAPDSLRTRVVELTGAAGTRRGRLDELTGAAGTRRAPRWRRTLVMPVATALAIVIAALVVAVGGSGKAPTVPQTARVALAAATRPAPAPDTARPGLLALGVDGLAFPSYNLAAGWAASGSRIDALDGRRIVTVFYTVSGAGRVGYAIVSGRPLTISGGTTVTRGGVRYTLQVLGGARLVTWQRAGHTCVIAGRRASERTLLALAMAEERGPA